MTAASEAGALDAELDTAARAYFDCAPKALALLDESLTVQACEGGGLFGLRVGEDVRDAFPALIGCEGALQGLKAGDPSFRLPPTAVAGRFETEIYVTFVARRQGPHIALYVEDATAGAEAMQRMVQQHNDLALAQDALAQARDRAEAANRAKNVFLANVSHDLRTPLSVIIGNAEILGQDRARPLTEQEARDYAHDISESGEYLLSLVNDLIDLSRAETGVLVLAEEWTSPGEVIDAALRIAGETPAATGKTFQRLIDPKLAWIYADPRRIRQALINLISNAVKFTEPGGEVRVRARLIDDGRAALEVSDDGPGMTPEETAVALRPFSQNADGKRRGGVGLGLAIVDSLVRAHKGDFEFDTKPGEGLTARILLPAERVAGE